MCEVFHGDPRELILFYLKKSRVFYDLYMEQGRTFFHAELILSQNEKILTLIPCCIDPSNPRLIDALMKLSIHIETWVAQFRKQVHTDNPSASDVFVFETLIPFPKKSAETIVEILS